jgi:ArsR family transcriptional regulator, arsenate/arsenite/antimonite-responsive transcriptional repressor
MNNEVRVFKALSDPTRLRIVKLLQKSGELCVCEIMKALDMTQTRASRNLGVLKNAGLVKDNRKGLWVHYSLETGEKGCCGGVLGLIKGIMNDDEAVKEDYIRVKKSMNKKERACVK